GRWPAADPWPRFRADDGWRARPSLTRTEHGRPTHGAPARVSRSRRRRSVPGGHRQRWTGGHHFGLTVSRERYPLEAAAAARPRYTEGEAMIEVELRLLVDRARRGELRDAPDA